MLSSGCTILLHSPPFSSILLHFTPFYSILLHSTQFYSILLNSTQFSSILLHSTPFYSILLHSTQFSSILLNSTPFSSILLSAQRYYSILTGRQPDLMYHQFARFDTVFLVLKEDIEEYLILLWQGELRGMVVYIEQLVRTIGIRANNSIVL